ncbi:hypothetical protein GYA27_03100 [candidate division WWE3 bacterium]|uniref:Bacterial toxin RNase RnlA/LsoA DBD domain-containing protein n=1 Tax=candidate division WWE3 bacterium TaxID=2053526 RepID=A0A7X9HH95_UNCKA|nr:hypothetical protein [candidate division WWE3 bacterium]
MMVLIERNTGLWQYLPDEIQGLIADGETLVNFVLSNNKSDEISDFSFMVFPFAKAYEGFLKKLFLDIGMIKPDEYYGDDIRIGRILNPSYLAEKGNVFAKFCEGTPDKKELSQKLWGAWKQGRNSVFHYFPHNFKKLDFEEAMDLIRGFVTAMEEAVVNCNIPKEKLNPIKSAYLDNIKIDTLMD